MTFYFRHRKTILLSTGQELLTEAYINMTSHLLNWKMNIEYVATNLEARALRAIEKGFQPPAFY
jgi:hypothetical protein